MALARCLITEAMHLDAIVEEWGGNNAVAASDPNEDVDMGAAVQVETILRTARR
jgi:hypothetical protein